MPLHYANGQVAPNPPGLPAGSSLGPLPPQFLPEPVPGPTGANAYTITTSALVMPPADGITPALVTVKNSGWIAVGQPIFIAGAGMLTAQSTPNMSTLWVINSGTSGNAAPTTVIGAGAAVAPGGINAPSSATPPPGAQITGLSNLVPTGNTVTGANATSPVACQIAAGVLDGELKTFEITTGNEEASFTLQFENPVRIGGVAPPLVNGYYSFPLTGLDSTQLVRWWANVNGGTWIGA